MDAFTSENTGKGYKDLKAFSVAPQGFKSQKESAEATQSRKVDGKRREREKMHKS